MSMNRLQIVVLGVSVVAFGGAYFVFNNYLGTQRKAQVIVQAPKLQTDEGAGRRRKTFRWAASLTESLVTWADWPKDNRLRADDRQVRRPRTSRPNSRTRCRAASFLRGEPLRRDKLVKAGVGGYMAAMLPSGMRAVAIKIDNSGDTSAGGFILPNDRVDVVRVYRDEEATRARGTEVLAHQTVLANVRVLAIGQNVQDQNGKKVVVGGNATLELDPKQAEIVLFAQNMPPAPHLIWCCAASSTAPARPKPSTTRRNRNPAV